MENIIHSVKNLSIGFRSKQNDEISILRNITTNIKKGETVGIVGESHIWDGPLDQVGRPHGKGWSAGITGMQVLKADSPYKAGPITQNAKEYK